MTRPTRRGLLGGVAALAAAPVVAQAEPVVTRNLDGTWPVSLFPPGHHPRFDPLPSGSVSDEPDDAELLRLGVDLAEAIMREDAAWADVDAFAASDDDDDPHRALASERMDDVGDLVKLIGEVPATTLDGLLVKLRAILWCQSGDVFEAVNLEIGMGEGPPSTHSVVLAGLLNDMVAMGRGA